MSIDVLPARTAALDQVATLQLPTKRDEAWRYAPHKALGELAFGSSAKPAAVPSSIDDQIPAIDGPRVVIVTGVVGVVELASHAIDSVLEQPDVHEAVASREEDPARGQHHDDERDPGTEVDEQDRRDPLDDVPEKAVYALLQR